MPLTLDRLDVAILRLLISDGRASFRQIARRVGATTPTVEARYKKMVKAGLIKRVSAILDADKVESGVSALIFLKVDPSKQAAAASYFAQMDEVRNVFMTTGEANVVIRVVTRKGEGLQAFIDSKLATLVGVRELSSQVITRTIKDEQGVALDEGMAIDLRCDYCGGRVSGRPYTWEDGGGRYFFCCRTCQRSYKEKYRARLRLTHKKAVL